MSKIKRKERNEKGSKVEADVAMCPLLSLFRREENKDGDTYMPYALHNNWSIARLLILTTRGKPFSIALYGLKYPPVVVMPLVEEYHMQSKSVR